MQLQTLTDQDRFPHIIVGTPGRILDLAGTPQAYGDLNLSCISFVVLDEADRMLDMGFQPELKKILEKYRIPRNRQVIMTSATWPPELEKAGRAFLNRPVKITVGEIDMQVVETIEQHVIRVINDAEKFKILMKKIEEIRKSNEPDVSEESDTSDDEEDETGFLAPEAPEVYHPVEPERAQPEPVVNAGWGSDDNDIDNGDGWDVEPENGNNDQPNHPIQMPAFDDHISVDFKMIVFCSRRDTGLFFGKIIYSNIIIFHLLQLMKWSNKSIPPVARLAKLHAQCMACMNRSVFKLFTTTFSQLHLKFQPLANTGNFV